MGIEYFNDSDETTLDERVSIGFDWSYVPKGTIYRRVTLPDIIQEYHEFTFKVRFNNKTHWFVIKI